VSGRQLDRLADALSLLFTVLVSLGAGVLIIYLTSKDPAGALKAFFIGPFSNRLFFGNMLQAASPLLFTGVGIAIAFRAGAFNLGGEGQVYAGGLVGTAVLLYAPWHTAWIIPVAAVAAIVAGAAFAGLSGWLRTRFGATEVITSFLIGSTLIYLFEFFLRRYLVDPTAGFPATAPLAPAFRFSRVLMPSNLNLSFFIGLAMVVLVHVVMFRTGFGYQLRMAGLNPRFARSSGMPVGRLFVIAMALSGAFAALAGIFAVTGVQGRLVTGFSANYGWNGITVALIARLYPLGVIPAALLYGYLHAGANTAALLSDVSPRIAAIIQSLIFYLITAQAIFAWIRRGLARRSDTSEGPAAVLPGDREPLE
jgi:riboflavin transport system permease protein